MRLDGRKKDAADPRRLRARLLLVAGFLAGCAAPPPSPRPPVTPRVSVEVETLAGDPLSGPRPEPVLLEGAEFARVTVLALEKLPGDVFESLAGRARLIVAYRGGAPIRPPGRLAVGARAGAVDGVQAALDSLGPEIGGRSVRIDERVATVPVGGAGFVRIRETGASAPERQLSIALSRPAAEDATPRGGIRVTAVVDGLTEPVGESTAEGISLGGRTVPPAPDLVPEREAAQLEDALRPGERPLALVIPSPFGPEFSGAFLIVVEALNAPRDLGPAEQARALEMAAQEIEAGRKRAAAASPARDDLGAAISGASKALGYPFRRRKALLYLAQTTGAPLSGEMATTAPDAVVARLCERALTKAKERETSATPEEWGWILESSALEALMDAIERDEVTPELDAVLCTHAGQAGRVSGSLARAIDGTRTVKEMEQRIVEENFIYLDDGAPSARARAFDWLRSRGLAPPGYDPLGTSKERREAIEKAAAASSTGTPVQEEKP